MYNITICDICQYLDMRLHIIVLREVMCLRLKDIREDLDLTQREIAQYLNIGQNTYSQYETGHRQLPIDVLIKLSEYYNVSTDYILGLTANPKKLN